MGNTSTDDDQLTQIKDESRRGDVLAFYAAIVRTSIYFGLSIAI